ncbi:hypothetical protein ACH5RR_021173 [Cinchona calisaya]|uniref:Uncharacterized protein n=1 Tax=Cinchona calisaya TaxID=153742 RepID=A0ABD2ZHK6_9GENT
MVLHDNLEPSIANLLHRRPLPTFCSSLSKLISEETRLQNVHPKSTEVVTSSKPRPSYFKEEEAKRNMICVISWDILLQNVVSILLRNNRTITNLELLYKLILLPIQKLVMEL